MKNKKEILTVCVSVEELFSTGRELKDRDLFIEHEKDDEQEWFDLKSTGSGIMCMDGESCEVVEIYENYDVLLKNTDGESVKEFMLSEEEFKISTGSNAKEMKNKLSFKVKFYNTDGDLREVEWKSLEELINTIDSEDDEVAIYAPSLDYEIVELNGLNIAEEFKTFDDLYQWYKSKNK